ncbi:MAG: alpha-glucan family phosphorylase [Chloroflexota bacterium]
MTGESLSLKLPPRIGRLEELAYNLWWSWHPDARALFRALDYPLWRTSGHNPVKQLREIAPDKLQVAATDPAFISLYDSVMSHFDDSTTSDDTWFTTAHPDKLPGPVAYFSAEFAIHNSLPIYAGGLGVLAGDLCKEASDLGIPLVGVGFMYPQGYFHQHLSAEGWQEEIYQQLDFDQAPVKAILSAQGGRPLARVELENRTLYIGVCQVKLGRATIYLLDTNIEENALQDRQLSARLYIAEPESRIQQELVLGIGGVRVLRALGIEPSIWHINEGHTAFMMLERVREEVQKGTSFVEAVRKVRAATVFTTHTPVPAGHDAFPLPLIDKYFHQYWPSLGIDRNEFIRLGQHESNGDQAFNMTVLALKMSEGHNAVSQLHEQVARKMWHMLWPQLPEENIPIGHVTNGIHVPTWVAPELEGLYEGYLGKDWRDKHDDPAFMQKVLSIPDEEFWSVHVTLKNKLMAAIRERAQNRWADSEATAQQVLAIGSLLDPEALTIGFVRRFTEYKRPTLVFHDMERLKRIITNQGRPVQIIFAGKSHPADFPSKYFLHQVYSLAIDREFRGRIVFIEDYDLHMARYLVQGVDVWLNTPRRLQEACGTSGMKASLNGVLHLSVRDGWWQEGFNGTNGWAIGDGPRTMDAAQEDRADAEALYYLMEEQIAPLYYERDRSGVPHGWTRFVKQSISSIVPFFCSRRMLKEYTQQFYMPALRLALELPPELEK